MDLVLKEDIGSICLQSAFPLRDYHNYEWLEDLKAKESTIPQIKHFKSTLYKIDLHDK